MPWLRTVVVSLAMALLLCACTTDPPLRRNAPPPGAGVTRTFADDLAQSLDAPMTDGNRIETLINGDEIFPSMLDAIRQATNSITFENFIWRSGALSDQFIQSLSERARSGVDVRVLIDAFGAIEFNNSDERRLRETGVRLVKYNPLWQVWDWNHRTHRKLMVVDGRIGFIGGACVGDTWLGNAEREPLWRDTHYRIEGPVVAQIQRTIQTNWFEMTGQCFPEAKRAPSLENAGRSVADCFCSGPNEGRHNAHQSYVEAIRAAKKSIRLQHSYFVPDRSSIRALVAARERGVRVEVMTPGVIHANVVRRASRSLWEPLIDAGVEFYEFQGSRFHCKLMIVDDAWVSVGSINFDERSFHINDEANLQVLDPEFAAKQIAMFEQDKLRTLRVTRESYKRRGVWIRLVENCYGLFRSVL
ncbi:MAG TPA: phospholipase D-like domain-containing protein [Candidatus Acidoferrum sp.]|nr:phospholipase D-like domain-containing protein [Candidatus Acidoferrum sp.]